MYYTNSLVNTLKGLGYAHNIIKVARLDAYGRIRLVKDGKTMKIDIGIADDGKARYHVEIVDVDGDIVYEIMSDNIIPIKYQLKKHFPNDKNNLKG